MAQTMVASKKHSRADVAKHFGVRRVTLWRELTAAQLAETATA